MSVPLRSTHTEKAHRHGRYNLDEEAAKLSLPAIFQQAYQASAKMIQVANSIFDSLIQTLSR